MLKEKIINTNKPVILMIGAVIALAVNFLPSEGMVFPFLIFCIGLFIGMFFINLMPEQDNKFLISLFLLAFLSRIFASLYFFNAVFLYKGNGMLGDAWPFSQSGYDVLQMWLAGIRDIKTITDNMMKITASGNLGSYDFWNAVVYFFTGKSPMSVIFINCLAGSLAVIFIYYITKQMCSIKAAKIAAILTAFWPSIFMWSIQNLKESSSIFLIVFLMWAMLNLKTRFRFHFIFLVFILSLALKEMRLISFFVFYILVVPFALFLSICRSKRLEFIFLGILIIFIGVSLFEVVKLQIVKLIPFFPTRGNIEFLKWAYEMRTNRATGGTAFLTGLNLSNPLNLVFFVPTALLIAWLAPFPWQVGSMSQISAIPEMLVYYMLIPSIFSGYRFIMKHRVSEGGLLIIAYIFIMMIVLAFIEGNIGTLFRHRAMVLPFLFVLIGIGLEKITFKITAHD